MISVDCRKQPIAGENFNRNSSYLSKSPTNWTRNLKGKERQSPVIVFISSEKRALRKASNKTYSHHNDNPSNNFLITSNSYSLSAIPLPLLACATRRIPVIIGLASL